MNRPGLLLFFVLICVSQLYSQKIRILPLGDSITDGEGLPLPDSELTGYRQPLWLLLKSNGYDVDFVGSNSFGYSSSPEFDPDNAGFGGYSAKQILHLLKTGYGAKGRLITPGPYLNYFPADIILLHIGTNELDTSASYVENILSYIHDFEDTTNTAIWIVLARIINEVPYSINTTIFNNNLEKVAQERIKKGDKIIIVNMEKDAGLIYKIDTTRPFNKGDMYDRLHPNESGYRKMASLFYDSLSVLIKKISPVEFAGLSYYDNAKSRVLFWQTSLELRNYGFEVQRSSGNNNWDDLGFIKGNKNSHHIQTYYFIDSTISLNHSNKNLEYRLKQIESDGSSKNIAELNIGNENIKQDKTFTALSSLELLTSYDKSDEIRVHSKRIWWKLHRSLSDVYYKGNKNKVIKNKQTSNTGLFYFIFNMLRIESRILLSFV